MTNHYENNLWTFLNLEENEQEKLSELANEIKTYTGENYLKLKLKIALQSNEQNILEILNVNNDDFVIKDTDSAELTLLKKKVVDKNTLSIDDFDNLFTSHLELLKTKNDNNDVFLNDLLNYIDKKSDDKEQVRRKTLNILEGEPENDCENPYSKENIINKFKELWNNNNDIYAKISSDYKNNFDSVFNKIQADFQRYISVMLRWKNNYDIDEDSKYKVITGFAISASLVVLILGVKFGKGIKNKALRLIRRIKLLLGI
ncbi:hypothetical protein FOG51_01375 [Hanseniaspora uvarum]|mgnify:FL=1|nr:hypothetical protein FOG51_01375 [Hanseniaspora uvarum]KAF0278805.1 hypothetical protein FOG50_00354 [Hanseniaspora uvarum]KKA02541.1 hypothetical protein D499_0I01220 [Hanseniaspora uvarum DSM 2768]GMM42600.1 hypothetical protein DAHU10_035100 [Hanseniaspora uvarum]